MRKILIVHFNLAVTKLRLQDLGINILLVLKKD